MPSFTYVTLLRHGDRPERKPDEPRVPGPALSTTGVAQAKRVAKYLAPCPFDVIICSDMLRAEQTAQFVNKYQHKKIIIVPDIEECNKVVFTGCNKIIFGTSPDNMEKYERELARARRSIRFFKAILRKYEGKHILLVGHGNSFRAIIGSVLGFSIADSPFISLEPCSLSTLVFKKQRLLGIPHLNLCVQNSQPLPFNDKLPRMRLAALGGKLSR